MKFKQAGGSEIEYIKLRLCGFTQKKKSKNKSVNQRMASVPGMVEMLLLG
jgi:hypothetical protein